LNIEEQMNMFWLGDDQEAPVDKDTGDFYFWLGGQGEDVTTSMLTRKDFEQMLADMDNGKTYS